MISFPTPGQEKIVSVTTAKASVEPNSRPKTVTSGMAINRSTWRLKMVHSLSPAARAKRTVSVNITSRVPARARRISNASLNRARLIDGSSMCLSPLAVKKLQSTPNNGMVSPRPPAGNMPRLTANVKININPIQNVGTENPRTEIAMIIFDDSASGA